MSANFFKLPESDKRKIWAALVAEWQKKKARAAARGALLLWPSVCTGGAICCAGCIPVHIVGGGGLLPVPVPGCWRWH